MVTIADFERWLQPFGGDVQLGILQFSVIDIAVLAVVLGVVVAAAAGLWRVGKREDRRARLDTVLHGAPGFQEEEQQRPSWYERLAGLMTLLTTTRLVDLAGRQRLIAAMTKAGIHGEEYLAGLVACKVCGAMALAAVWWWTSTGLAVLSSAPLLQWATVAIAFLLGAYAPELVLTRLATRRKQRLEHGFPEALDLLVICAEAGLALPQAIEEVTRALQNSEPEIAAEFSITGAELRVLDDRTAALENMVNRTGIESLRSLTSTLNQSMRFGTSLADALRVLSSDMRADRMARMDENAARLPVLLSIPLMLLLMPALLIVIGSPVALKVADMIAGRGP